MKNLYTFLFTIFCLCNVPGELISQWQTYHFPGLPNRPIATAFVNANTGWVLYDDDNGTVNRFLIYKTTDKGNSWAYQVNTLTDSYSCVADISCTDENHCWFIYVYSAYAGYQFYMMKTSDGGATWSQTSNVTGLTGLQGSMTLKFVSNTDGYFLDRWGPDLYKTTNGGNNWFKILGQNLPASHVFNDIQFSEGNSEKFYVAGSILLYGSDRPYLFKTANGGTNFDQIFDGTYESNDGGIRKLCLKSYFDGTDLLSVQTNSKYHAVRTVNNYNYLEMIWPMVTDYHLIRLNSSDLKNVYAYWENQNTYCSVIKSTDGGYNWQTDLPNYAQYDFQNVLKELPVFGEICYLPQIYGDLSTRLMHIDFNTNCEWVLNPGGLPNELLFNNKDGHATYDIHTHSSGDYRGGYCDIIKLPENERFVVNTNGDTTNQFYYWGGIMNASMNMSLYNYYYDKQGGMNADYKGHLMTNTNEALKYPSQVKAIKDTVINEGGVNIGGYTNLVYESMGGIFFTRTKAGSDNFKCEEIISGTAPYPYNTGYATFQNSNPYIAEIHPLAGAQSREVDAEKNVAVTWERLNGGNIEIHHAARTLNEVNYPLWTNYNNQPVAVIQNVPPGFHAYPKLFEAATQTSNNVNYLYVTTYLKPSGTSTNTGTLWCKVIYPGGCVENQITQVGVISDYSVAGIYSWRNNHVFDLHITYVQNNKIYYDYVQASVQGCLYQGAFHQQISPNDGQNHYTPDITLRATSADPVNPNLQPVISYLAQYQVRIIIGGIGMGSMDVNYYPINIRERQSSGIWAPQFIQYNSAALQQYPNIEGSKTRNSYIVSYSQNGTTFFQRVPRWENSTSSGYYCTPGAYQGLDAKFVKGALLNQGSLVQSLMTLSGTSAPYNVGKQNFTITNNQQINDGTFDGIYGVLEKDNMQYSFNLGSIMVNGNLNYFNAELDSNYQLNNFMHSGNFFLTNGDTLVLGRDAYYIPSDTSGVFAGIEYWVDLVSSSTGYVKTTLIHDTIHVADTIHLEYLDGFVISDIHGGSDSFYVQLRIDSLFNSGTIGGGLIDNGGGGNGDSPFASKKKIFWHDGRTEKIHVVPTVFNLYQNYPNPFNPMTTIKYDLPKDVNVTIKVYDLLGKEVTRLVNNEFRQAGTYQVIWNANNYASGVYICRIQAGDFTSIKKMVLLK